VLHPLTLTLALSLAAGGCAHEVYFADGAMVAAARAYPPAPPHRVAVEAVREDEEEPVWLRLHAFDRNPSEPAADGQGGIRLRLREPRWGAMVGALVLAGGAALLGGGLWRVDHAPGGELPDVLGVLLTAGGAVQSAFGVALSIWGLIERPWLAGADDPSVVHLPALPR
jgi:hypothetical protein